MAAKDDVTFLLPNFLPNFLPEIFIPPYWIDLKICGSTTIIIIIIEYY